jgi:predicted glycosyltransferase
MNSDILIIKNHGHKFKLMAASDIMIATNSYASVEATLLGVFTINFIPGIDIIGEKFCSEFNKNCMMISYDIDNLCEYLIKISDEDLNYKDDLLKIQQTIIGVENRQTVEEVINEYM